MSAFKILSLSLRGRIFQRFATLAELFTKLVGEDSSAFPKPRLKPKPKQQGVSPRYLGGVLCALHTNVPVLFESFPFFVDAIFFSAFSRRGINLTCKMRAQKRMKLLMVRPIELVPRAKCPVCPLASFVDLFFCARN